MTIVPIVVGPTAVGKTETVIRALEDLNAEIISADSRQIYRYMDIGTAKPDREQRQKMAHHLVDCIDPNQPFDAALYGRMARDCISEVSARGKMPVVVGGSGFYLRALRHGFFDGPGADPILRRDLVSEERRHGQGTLHRHLTRVDPQSAGRIHPHDVFRTVRALEVYRRTGKSLSEWHQNGRYQRLAVPSYIVGLYRSRAELYRRIEDRVAGMISQGLVEEVRSLIERGYSQDLKALSTVGYQEILAHLTDRIDLDEAVRLVIRNTRQYARRQMTWFIRQEEVFWIPADEEKELIQIIKGLRQGRRPGDERVKRQREQMRRVWVVKTSTGLKKSA